MSFELAVVMIVALIAVGLGLVSYHLLGRLEMLEQAVQGGLEPPSTRLSREQFEGRFRTAHARASLAADIDTGVLLVVGPEHQAGTELSATLENLQREDLITVRSVADVAAAELGITTTPYLFVIDEGRVREARPVAASTDVIEALKGSA